MSRDVCLSITLILVLSACDEETPESDSGTDSTDTSHDSEADETEDADISSDEFSQDEELPSECGTAVTPGCGEGRLCVQTQPPYCTSDYIGFCMSVPENCADIPERIVCACDSLTIYRNECEARQAGFGGLLIECP